MQRILGVVVLVLGLVACGGKNQDAADPETAAVVHYLNVDMNAPIGMLWVGKRPLEKIEPSAFEDAAGWFEHPSGIDTIVIPRLTDFIAAAEKITPPPSEAAAHAMIIDVAKSYREVASELAEAAIAKDKPKFLAAHEKLMATHASYLRWQGLFDSTLSTRKITFKDPAIPPPYPKN